MNFKGRPSLPSMIVRNPPNTTLGFAKRCRIISTRFRGGELHVTQSPLMCNMCMSPRTPMICSHTYGADLEFYDSDYVAYIHTATRRKSTGRPTSSTEISGHLSACTKHRMSLVANSAAAFICRERPSSVQRTTVAPACSARLTVLQCHRNVFGFQNCSYTFDKIQL